MILFNGHVWIYTSPLSFATHGFLVYCDCVLAKLCAFFRYWKLEEFKIFEVKDDHQTDPKSTLALLFIQQTDGVYKQEYLCSVPVKFHLNNQYDFDNSERILHQLYAHSP